MILKMTSLDTSGRFIEFRTVVLMRPIRKNINIPQNNAGVTAFSKALNSHFRVLIQIYTNTGMVMDL